jgi:class 3 adenylate cyclase
MSVSEQLDAGRGAAARNAWDEAFAHLSAADSPDAPLSPPDLEVLAEAGWWTARLDACIDARERAFAGYVDGGEPRKAAKVAMALAKDYHAKGASAIGSAWVKRAERLLAGEADCVEQGWLHRLRSVIALEGAGDHETALSEARLARKLAERFTDPDLLAVALHDEGRALVMKGDVDEGLALIDEATAPATAGELTPFNTAVIYCNTITACKELADYRRAGDWSDAAKRWCERQAIAGFPGMCRVYRASIMALRGAWPEAELEALRACEELPSFNRSYAAAAFYELGEIRLRAGDLPACEQAFRQAHELGRDPQPGLALLRLAQGNVDAAQSCITQALDAESGELHRARLLPAFVEVALAAADGERAAEAAGELERIATRYGTEAFQASARSARAKVALAGGDVPDAVRTAREALQLWQAAEAPYEAARARLLLADAHAAAGHIEDAALELGAAAATFDRLGAQRDLRTARDRLARIASSADSAASRRAAHTFMFTDIVRSTNLVEAIGDDAWADLVAWHDKTLRSLFAAHGGEEIDHAGDGFFVAFAMPESALDCAVAIQRSLAAHRREHGFAPQVRIGLHATEATAHGAGYKGRGVHEAARISAVAEGSEIVASRATVAGNGSAYPISEPRRIELKGIEAPVELVSVDWR